MGNKTRKFALGDLVVCKYDFEYLYYPYPSTYPLSEEDYGPFFHTGIVIDMREDTFIYFDRTMLYEVLCTDGNRRRFTPWEMELLRSGSSP